MRVFFMAKTAAAPSPDPATADAAPPQPLTPQRQLETMTGLYRQLTSTLEGILPLLGLVLFGDPQVAKRFYRENFAVAMDRLAEAWREVEDRYGFPFESPDISARAVMGFFPALQPARRRR